MFTAPAPVCLLGSVGPPYRIGIFGVRLYSLVSLHQGMRVDNRSWIELRGMCHAGNFISVFVRCIHQELLKRVTIQVCYLSYAIM